MIVALVGPFRLVGTAYLRHGVEGAAALDDEVDLPFAVAFDQRDGVVLGLDGCHLAIVGPSHRVVDHLHVFDGDFGRCVFLYVSALAKDMMFSR